MFQNSISDEELMALYQRGDQSAFQQLLTRHKRGVYGYILRYTGNEQESEEVFQDVFIKMHRAAPNWVPTAKFSTWLYTIVRNLCIDVYRKKKIRRTLSLDATEEGEDRSLYDVIPSEDPHPDSQSSDAEIGKVLEAALAKINPDQKEVFLLRGKNGLKFEEIAEVLGVSVNTVKSRMRYACETLKNILEKSGYKDLNPNG